MLVNLAEVITLDFETYWAHDFSLSSKTLNPSEYIRSPQFLAHCCAIKIGKGKTRVVPGAKLKEAFAKIDWANTDVVAHNMAFDGAILAWHYGIKPRFYFDTLSMARGLHGDVSRASLDTIAKYYGIGAKSTTYLAPTKGLRELTPEIYSGLAEGCAIDTDLCYEIFCKQIEVYPEDELALIDLTMRMFIDPVLHVDIPRAEQALEYEKQARLRAMALSLVDEKTLNSSPKFAQALRDAGCEPPMKWSVKQNCMAHAFAQSDPEFIELQDHENIRVVRLAQGRLAAKSTIVETRAYRLIQAGRGGQKLPVMLNYFGAKTGRWCMPGDAEVLTPAGWVRMDEYAGQVIAQWNPETKTTDWCASGTMNTFPLNSSVITVAARHCRGFFTPEHTFARQTTNGAFKSEPAKEIFGKNIRVITPTKIAGGDDIPDELVRLIVATEADGCFRDGGHLVFAFRKARKIQRLAEILAKNKMPYSIHKSDTHPETKFYISRAQIPTAVLTSKEHDVEFIMSLSLRNREAYIDELSYWDGSIKSNTTHYCTTKLAAAELVSAVAASVGLLTNIHVGKRETPQNDKYTVTIREHEWVGVPSYSWGTQHFKGQVYCPTTDTGFFVVRSQGTVFVTGNSGGNKLNLQNLNRQEYDDTGTPVPMTGELRKSIIAPKDHVILVCDSAQIEARTLAWLAEQEDLVEAFRNGEDVYKKAACDIYGVPVEEITKDMRFVGKVATLGLGYAMGAPKFQTTLALGMMGPPVKLSAELCKKTVNTYRRVNHMIPALWKEADRVLAKMAAGKEGDWGVLSFDETSVWLPNGMGLHYPGLKAIWDPAKDRVSGYTYMANGKPKKIYGGLLVENIVQALARIIVSSQMLLTQEYFKTLKLRKSEVARIASMSHDEIISVVPARLADKAKQKQIDIMRIAPDWAEGLPLNAEAGYAFNYSK